MATENGDSSESGRVDVCVETSESAGWLDDSRLNLGLVRDGQEKKAVIGLKRRVTNLNGMTFLLRQNSSNTGLNGKV